MSRRRSHWLKQLGSVAAEQTHSKHMARASGHGGSLTRLMNNLPRNISERKMQLVSGWVNNRTAKRRK